MRIEWSSRAVADLQSISEYIEENRSLEVANRVARSIYDAIQQLRKTPKLGRPGRLEGTRELVLAGLPYLAVYVASADRIVILDIVHGAQKWP
jgi:toxin ParE1/3/4